MERRAWWATVCRAAESHTTEATEHAQPYEVRTAFHCNWQMKLMEPQQDEAAWPEGRKL